MSGFEDTQVSCEFVPGDVGPGIGVHEVSVRSTEVANKEF